jgi:micrococcal nuclease
MVDWFLAIILFVVSWFGIGSDEIAVTATTTPVFAEVVRVIDGDTIDVKLGDKIERVRYIGIDSPEVYENSEPECFSQEASEANRLLVEGKIVELKADKENRDKYDRLLRYVFVDGVYVNEVLLDRGYADLMMIPPNTSELQSFTEVRDRARLKRIGLWAKCEL